MSSPTTTTPDNHVQRTLSVLRALLERYRPRNFAIRLWDGTTWTQEVGQPCRFTLILNRPSALRQILFPLNERHLAETYMHGDFDVEGDMLEAISLAKVLDRSLRWTDLLRYLPSLLRLPAHNTISTDRQAHLTGQQHSITRDRQAIQYHYDVSNAFYQHWLDKQMIYSCAYFNSEHDNLEIAQQQKLDYLCRKLRLKANERLLDLGCGWGALLIHAAKYYGVSAVGVTLSKNQADYARDRIARERLERCCKVELMDYRELDESRPFDKIVSVGMVEHVGRDHLHEYFEKAYRLLHPGGVFLNHGITAQRSPHSAFQRAQDSFFKQYVFPDGDVQPIAYILNAADEAGFEVRDVENLREHYALTLKHWYARYEARKQAICDCIGNVGYRQWCIYLVGARWLFENALLGVCQTLLYKHNDEDISSGQLPLTRMDWY